MKWAVVTLIVLGVVAAACVAILVAALPHYLGAGAAESEEVKEVKIVVAAEDLSGGRIIEAESVTTKMVPVTDIEPGVMKQESTVIGKVLSRPMKKGQEFMKDFFAVEGSNVQLAAMIGKGHRAVTLAVADSAGLRGLLYPGCKVDILAVFSLRGTTGEAISTTLLEKVQVLSVDEQTVFSDPEEPAGGARASAGGGKMMVTVEVDPQQAQVLQVAMKHGSVRLSLRNPTDVGDVTADPTRLSELTYGAGASAPTGGGPIAMTGATVGGRLTTAAGTVATAERTGTSDEIDEPDEVDQPRPAERVWWETTIIRGPSTQKVMFPVILPGNGNGTQK
ncbi:MAG: Flp pilus assembly protein CpaB [Planctomycetota bacterium]|jgi:pilus assembly protein CpaB